MHTTVSIIMTFSAKGDYLVLHCYLARGKDYMGNPLCLYFH